MSRHPARLTMALALFAVGLRWVWNSNDWSGPVVLSLTPAHGVHLNDWLTIVLWSFALLAAFPFWVSELSDRLRRLVLTRRALTAPAPAPVAADRPG